MCSHYESPKKSAQFILDFGVDVPEGAKVDVWPCYASTFIRRPPEADSGDEAVPKREALLGLFGLVPHWAKDRKIGRQTYNARSETVAEKPSFRDAWKKAQHCIIPAQSFYEPDWRSGKAVSTQIARVDGKAMGIAGLWAYNKVLDQFSFTMLTMNADDHPFMRNFFRPEDEKRIVAILPEESYDDWLSATPERSKDFVRQFPAEELKAFTNEA